MPIFGKKPAGKKSSHQDTWRDEPLEYEPLDLGRNEIRLVRLYPGAPGSGLKVHIDILKVSIDNAPPYKALSYAWGKDSKRVYVKTTYGPCRVSDTLMGFFEQAEETNEDSNTCYWVDAICIDQSNVPERNEQVLRMKEIYEAAQQIVVWLDAPDFVLPWAVSKFSPKRIKPDALVQIYECAWWKRAWIIQEASTPAIRNTSQTIVIWVGENRCDFDACLQASERLRKTIVRGCNRLPLPPMVNDLAWIRAQRADAAARLEIYDLLPRVRRCEASDMRDKIYSILAISCDYNAKDLKPAYGKPTAEIYTSLVRYLIERDQKLDILAYCTAEKNIESLPSWVPDWSYNHVPVPFPRRAFNACADLPWKVSFQNWGSSIRCKGIHIAQVHAVSPVREQVAERVTNESALSQTWFNFGMLNLSRDSYHRTYEQRLDTLRRVVCADIFEWDGAAKRNYTVAWPTEDFSRRFQFERLDFVNNSDMDKATNSRRLMLLYNDMLGLGPAEASPGDHVFVLGGLQVPLVLRQVQEHFIIIGACYIHGIMDGQVLGWKESQICDIDICTCIRFLDGASGRTSRTNTESKKVT